MQQHQTHIERIWFSFALLALSGCSSLDMARASTAASDGRPVSDQEVCAVVQCQHNVRIVLKQQDGSTYDRSFDAMPVVQPAGVSVYAGQTVRFEADVVDGKLSNLKLVDRVVDPGRTIVAKLEQDEDGGMLLTTTNPFDKHVRIRMGMLPLAHDRLVPTSSCPVIAGGSSFEMWPYPIFQVFLGDLHLMADDEPMVCAE